MGKKTPNQRLVKGFESDWPNKHRVNLYVFFYLSTPEALILISFRYKILTIKSKVLCPSGDHLLLVKGEAIPGRPEIILFNFVMYHFFSEFICYHI